MSAAVAVGLALSLLAAAATSLGWLMKGPGARASAPHVRYFKARTLIPFAIYSLLFGFAMLIYTAT